jgi:hypothetical protein
LATPGATTTTTAGRICSSAIRSGARSCSTTTATVRSPKSGAKPASTRYGLGSICYFIDYDNDGWLDIVQNVWSDSEDVIHTLQNGEGPPDGQAVRVWRNNRDGTFSLRSRELGITGCWGSMSGNAGDINNDGYQDIILGNGSPRMERVEPLTLLQSDGRRFHDVTFTAVLPITGKSHGVNLADLFGDGRMTLIVASGGAYQAIC